jgi:hypothetical protein
VLGLPASVAGCLCVFGVDRVGQADALRASEANMVVVDLSDLH